MYEKIFDGLIQKYGEDFNWHILPIENSFDKELKKKFKKMITGVDSSYKDIF